MQPYFSVQSMLLFNEINRKSLQIGRYSFSLEDINCVECISQTVPTTIFGMIQHETADHLAKLIIELINPNYEQKDQPVSPEILLKVDLEPFQMLLHQKVMEFLMEFVLNSQNEILTKKALVEEEKRGKENRKSRNFNTRDSNFYSEDFNIPILCQIKLSLLQTTSFQTI